MTCMSTSSVNCMHRHPRSLNCNNRTTTLSSLQCTVRNCVENHDRLCHQEALLAFKFEQIRSHQDHQWILAPQSVLVLSQHVNLYPKHAPRANIQISMHYTAQLLSTQTEQSEQRCRRHQVSKPTTTLDLAAVQPSINQPAVPGALHLCIALPAASKATAQHSAQNTHLIQPGTQQEPQCFLRWHMLVLNHHTGYLCFQHCPTARC